MTRVNYVKIYFLYAYLSEVRQAFFRLLVLFFKFYLLIYFWLQWIFVAAHRLSLAVVGGGYSCCEAQAAGA